MMVSELRFRNPFSTARQRGLRQSSPYRTSSGKTGAFRLPDPLPIDQWCQKFRQSGDAGDGYKEGSK